VHEQLTAKQPHIGGNPSDNVRYGSIVDIEKANRDVRYVPGADINHHLFSAVVIALIRLVQFGGPGSLQSAAASVI